MKTNRKIGNQKYGVSAIVKLHSYDKGLVEQAFKHYKESKHSNIIKKLFIPLLFSNCLDEHRHGCITIDIVLSDLISYLQVSCGDNDSTLEKSERCSLLGLVWVGEYMATVLALPLWWEGAVCWRFRFGKNGNKRKLKWIHLLYFRSLQVM